MKRRGYLSFIASSALFCLAVAADVEVRSLGVSEISTRGMRPDDIAKMKNIFGVCEPGKNYNNLVQGHGTGLKPPTEEQYDRMLESARIVVKTSKSGSETFASSSVDHTTSIHFPPIANQGNEGTCVMFSTVYYIKTFQEATEHGWDLSAASWVGGYYGAPSVAYQDRIFSPDFVYHQVNGGADNGSTTVDAADVFENIGAATWSAMPYDTSDSTTFPPEAAWRSAPPYRGGDYIYLMIDDAAGLTQLKQMIDNGSLMSISVDSTKMHEMTTNDHYAGGYGLDHAGTVVGYDDNKSYSEGGVTTYGAVKVANSWGETWDEETTNDGCYWMSYKVLMDYCLVAQGFEDLTGYEPKMLGVFRVSHPDRDNCSIRITCGSSGEVLASKVVPVGSVINSDWNEYDISPSVEVDAGNKYLITLASTKAYTPSDNYGWRNGADNPYGAGDSNSMNSGDYCFRTYSSGDVLDQSQTNIYASTIFSLDYPAWQEFTPALSPLTKLGLNLDYIGAPGSLVIALSKVPSGERQLHDGLYSSGNHPYPSNNMALDLTEFHDDYLAGEKNFYLVVIDELDSQTGTVLSFSVELYDDYESGTPILSRASEDGMQSLSDGGEAYMHVALEEPPAKANAGWRGYR